MPGKKELFCAFIDFKQLKHLKLTSAKVYDLKYIKVVQLANILHIKTRGPGALSFTLLTAVWPLQCMFVCIKNKGLMKSFLIFLHHHNYVPSVLNSSLPRGRGENFQRINAFLQYNNKSHTLTQKTLTQGPWNSQFSKRHSSVS